MGSSNNFEKVIEENCEDTQIQNIFNVEKTIDDDLRLLTIALVKCFQPLGLFHDKYLNFFFTILFFGHPRPYFQCSYEKNTS
jgi:hypothetical protein